MDRLDSRNVLRQWNAMHRAAWLQLAGACVLAFVFPLTAAAQGKDDLWEVTMKMEMAGMPIAMPAQTNRVCTAKGKKDEDYVPRESNCKMTESNRAGGKLTYKMQCDGKNTLTVVGDIAYAADKYEGKSRMTGTMDGQPIDMTQTYSGKRIGDCTATK